PGELDLNAPTDQPVFAEMGLQGTDFVLVAAVEGRQRHERRQAGGLGCHGRGAFTKQDCNTADSTGRPEKRAQGRAATTRVGADGDPTPPSALLLLFLLLL